MAEYERSRTMPAQPEHVFDRAATLHQLDSWLQVAGIGSGVSEVTVRLSFFDKRHDPGEHAAG